MSSLHQQILSALRADIDMFLSRTGMAASRLGKEALGDPNFVSDLRAGRVPGLLLIDKVRAFMSEHTS